LTDPDETSDSWYFNLPEHRNSENWVEKAEMLLIINRSIQTVNHDASLAFAYSKAAEYEEAATNKIPHSKPELRLDFILSAINLWRQSRKEQELKRCALAFLQAGGLDESTTEYLKGLL
jgi:hypothetical protein